MYRLEAPDRGGTHHTELENVLSGKTALCKRGFSLQMSSRWHWVGPTMNSSFLLTYSFPVANPGCCFITGENTPVSPIAPSRMALKLEQWAV